ncbi:uncharacterized protein LOC129914488 [Episyrphus balteatus]|uniref:uncharacterized protein LOC129914488 n=1 Tax=Episyrphus balteatus TaxID=286459 RepID=UPI002485343D|nr:uncharacterized protein LOC129914488 [Episyrphus balteatus]
MFSLLNSSHGSPRIDKDVYELLFTVYNQRDTEGLKDCLEKSDALDVFRMVQEVNRELTSVKLENVILIDFLQKNDPRLLVGLDHVRKHSIEIRHSTMERRKSYVDSGGGSSPILGRSESRTTSIGGSTMGSMRRTATDYTINYRAKVEIAEKLAAEIQRHCEVLEAKGTQDIKILKGQIEEVQYRCADTEETIKNFKVQFLQNDVLENATEKQKEAQLRKFINNWLKNGRALLGTMRLKITSIQEKCHQQRTALISKADLSGMLGPVDFEQLQIKRDDQTRSLDEKNISLAGLKEVTGKASLSLAKEKKNLLAIEQKSKALQEKTADVVKGISKLEQESRIVEKELESIKESLKTIKIQVEEFEAPSITDYILKKQELIALEKEEKLLQRKSYIQNIKLQNMNMKLRSRNLIQ